MTLFNTFLARRAFAPIVREERIADDKPKKADQLNADLANASVYSKLDLKSVTSWLDLRNKAAHGKYSQYTKEQVQLMIQSVQDFMSRNPA